VPPPTAPFLANPLLLGFSPPDYVRRAVAAVRSAELEQALLVLPFPSALQLLDYLPGWLGAGAADGGIGCELIANVATLLLRLHQRQLAGSAEARGAMGRLRGVLRPRLMEVRDLMGFNLAATEHLGRLMASQAQEAEV